MSAPPPDAPGTALVVFTGEATLWWLRFLKPGFRHCYIAVRDDSRWVFMNLMSHQTELFSCDPLPSGMVADWLREHGCAVLATRIRQAPRKPAPRGPLTCVEAVKRVLGIQAPLVWTPWALHQHITKFPI